MRSILFLSNKNGLARFAPDLDLDFLKALHTRFQGPDWHIHIVKDTVEQDFDWLKTAAPYFGKVVHVVHHKLPRPEILNGLLARIAETSDAGTRLAPFDGMHEKLPENLRCLPYLKLARMLPTLQSGSVDADLLRDFEELWQLLERHDRQVKATEAYREALGSYNSSTPSKPFVSEAPLKLVGFPSEDATRLLLGEDVALCSLQDAEVLPKDRLVVLCETDKDENGKEVSLLQLAGVEWVKKLRREGKRNPVLFVSALGRKELLIDRPEFEILTALKHPFLKLDGGHIGQFGKDITKGLGKAGELDPLELEFVKQAYCSPIGLVQTLVHELYSVPEGDEFRKRALRVRDDAYRLLGEGKRAPIVPDDKAKDRKTLLAFVRAECDDLISKQPNGQQSFTQRADAGWELLLLDDDIKALSKPDNPHPLVQELEDGRKLKVHLAGSSQEALEFILADKASGRNQILLAVVDYHLRELQKDEVIGDQSEQGFHFVRHLSREAEYVKAVVLTAMPRRFVMDSLRHLGVGVGSVFSKLDYFKEGNYSLLADQIVELGNENAEAIARLPRLGRATNWSKHMEPYYLAHRRDPGYQTHEQAVRQEATECCNLFDKNGTPIRMLQNPPRNPLELPLKDPKSGVIEGRQMEAFRNVLVYRRLILWYALKNHSDSPEELAKALFDTSTVPVKSRKAIVSTICALRLKGAVWSTTIEEKHWLTHQVGMGRLFAQEVEESPIIMVATDEISKLIQTERIVLENVDSTKWGSLEEIRGWLDKLEVLARTNETLRANLVGVLQQVKNKVAALHPDAEQIRSTELKSFLHQLGTIGKRISRNAALPVHSIQSDEQRLAYERTVSEGAWARMGIKEAEARKALETDFFDALFKNPPLPIEKNAIELLCRVYWTDEGRAYRVNSTGGDIRDESNEESFDILDPQTERRKARLRVTSHPQQPLIDALGAIILGVNGQITEQAQWEAPSYYLKGHFATFFLDADDGVVRLVFDLDGLDSDDFEFLQPFGGTLHQAMFQSMEVVNSTKASLILLVNEIVANRLD